MCIIYIYIYINIIIIIIIIYIWGTVKMVEDHFSIAGVFCER